MSGPELLLLAARDDRTDCLRAYVAYTCGPLFTLGLARQRPGGLTPNPPHLGLVSLGTYAKREGVAVELMDNLDFIPAHGARVEDTLARGVPVVGISTTFLLREETIRGLMSRVRRLSPKSRIILGGAGVSRMPALWREADAVVRGQSGERALAAVVRGLREGVSLEGVPNLILPERGGHHFTAARDEPDLDGIPMPDWQLLPGRVKGWLPIEASKGCRYNCAYCSYPYLANQKLKRHAAVVDELERNRVVYGVRHHRFVDSNLTSWAAETEALCDEILARRLDVEWSCYARVDNMAKNPGLPEKMRAAGCRMIFFGVESGDDGILRSMRKGYGSRAVVEGLRRTRAAGIYAHANIIIGFPGETEKTVDNTLAVLREARPHTAAFVSLLVDANSTADIWESREKWKIEGSGSRWTHASMSSEEAEAHTFRASRAVVDSMPDTVLGQEVHAVDLLGYGLDWDETMDYFRALQDWHAHGEGSRPRVRSEEKLRGYWGRISGALDEVAAMTA